MKRRQFIKRVAGLGAGMLLAKPFLGETESTALAVAVPEHSPEPATWSDEAVTMSWIGHSTVLINFYGVWIITDPVFSSRVGVYMFGTTIGPSRYTHPAIALDDIPKPDIVLLSHAHMDHMDYCSLKQIANKFSGEVHALSAANTIDVIDELPWKSLQELDWRESTELNGVALTALEVEHFGWRYPWEKDRSRGFTKTGRSFNAYLLERYDKKVVFGGDTAMCDYFKELNDTNVDVAIMPIGAYQPWRSRHCTPEEALEMALHMNAKSFVPIHTNTFRQGNEPLNEPLKRMAKAAGPLPIEVGIGGLGQTLVV